MSHSTISEGYRKIHRHDGIFQEQGHDAYKSKRKPLEATVCSQCGAVFHAGRWQWCKAPENAHQATCPACHRIHDEYPAGFLSLKGEFFQSHRDEIMHLVHNHEQRERAEHPLKRIMAVEEKGGATLVTTTDIPTTSFRLTSTRKKPAGNSALLPAFRNRARCWRSIPWCCTGPGRIQNWRTNSSTLCSTIKILPS